MKKRVAIKFTANFENNLEQIEHYLLEAEIPHVFEGLLSELIETVIPNLERFPELGRLFTGRPIGSVEVNNGLEILRKKSKEVGMKDEVREYLLAEYLILYMYSASKTEEIIYLMSIKHHRQLSFDVESIWLPAP